MAAQTIPALIALLFKVALLAYALRSPRRHPTTRLFVVLLVLFSLHNAVEFFGLNHFAQHGLDRVMEWYGYSYFAIGILFIAVTLHLSLRLSTDDWDKTKSVVPLLYLPVPVLELLLLGTDKLVAGFQTYGDFSILRVPGPLYFLFEAYAPLYLLAALVYLVYGARSSRPSRMCRIRNRFWLIGLLPFVLLNAYLVVANHFGLARLSSTITNPIALTLFLVITTYAMHQYRLFDIEFFLPWSKVRKRKTAFYKQIQSVIAEIAEMRSVREILGCIARTLNCQVALVGGPRPLLATAPGQSPKSPGDLLLSQFPRSELEKVHDIVVAEEISETQPDLYALMKHHRVGAVVPYISHRGMSAHWMLLGERFSENVYTALDFKVAEALFNRIAERFLDDFTLLRSQLAEAQSETQDLRRRLAMAWDELTAFRKRLEALEEDNRKLRQDRAVLLRQNLLVVGDNTPAADKARSCRSLDQYMVECERRVVAEALRRCNGDRTEAARVLDIRLHELDGLIRRHGLSVKQGD